MEGLTTPAAVQVATEEFRSESDVVGRFLAEGTAAGSGMTGAHALYQIYRAWSENEGHKPMSNTALGRRLSRLDEAPIRVNGLGKATVTGILLIMFPQQYGVWNGTSEAGMDALDLLAARDGTPEGEYYVEIDNVFQVAQQLSRRMDIDLSMLDAL